jgi:TldD protein
MRFNVSIVTDNGTTQGQGGDGFGGRGEFLSYLTEEAWQASTQEALRQALVALDSGAAPAGEMDVLLGPGWPGILLHEAIGHGLEGDFNRKGTSAFAGLMGERIAAEGITVVDDGTIPNRRGSITIDDEGTPSNCTTLIENGILVNFMQDRLNARLMGVAPTGNGRRQSFAHAPMPRMTNTYMLNGKYQPDEILASMKTGLYAKSFGGGQVDITSGKFVFTVTEAYLIENGKLGRPVKGATLIGSGADALKRISMVGNDLALDKGIGTCGKQGQGVPVGVGQPTLRINGLTVGGTSSQTA